ncbi:MAG TPA: 2-dehydropantoate 2-reductase [Acetobacteraceae bacterium]|nr:2-dehydropantoate 2-reductase [Acetobacteraceae bacterium]
MPATLRILVVGAGAIGGYFGGRMLAAGRDVTFLVRPGRAAQLARDGLVIRSPTGDARLSAPPHVLAGDLREPFDLVLLSCKAYDLDSAMADVAPAVGPGTAILPLLNGLRHLDALDARFGAARVLGGRCIISSALDGDGAVLHLNTLHDIVFGERDGTASPRVAAIAAAMDGAGFTSRASAAVMLEMWEKWVFVAALAAVTCLMRAAVCDIMAAGGRDLALGLLEECRAIAEAAGHPPRAESLSRAAAMLTAPDAPTTASMLRDIERGGRIEADHMIGDLIARRDALGVAPGKLLPVVLAHLKAYEARQARERS